MRQRRVSVLGWALLLLLSACASTPPDPRLGIGKWLNAGERTILIDAPMGSWTGPNFVIRESRALAGAGQGFVESFQVVQNEVGLLLWPLFAIGSTIYGAASAEPARTFVPLSELEGAEALFETVSLPGELVERLGPAVVEFAGTRMPHRVLSVDRGKGDEEFPAVLAELSEPTNQAVATIALYARVAMYGKEDAKEEADPKVGFYVDGYTSYLIGAHPYERIGEWRYESDREPFSTWAAEDGRILREEIGHAVDELAEEIVDGIVALQRRAAAREKGLSRNRPP